MIHYFIEVSICWLLFYIIYRLFLSKETFFNINRWYLLSTVILGLIIPLFQFEALFYQEPIQGVSALAESFDDLEYVINYSVEEAKEKQHAWIDMLFIGYLLGVIIALARFIYGLSQIFQLYKSGSIHKKEQYVLVVNKKAHLPFSFFNYLFWSDSLKLEATDSGKILTHEMAHINQWHSLDVLFLEILSILLWFSPPIYLYKKSLRTVHEYLADAYVLRDSKKKQYGQLLIRQATSGMQIALANNFIHSQLKQRINMMTRNKSRRKALLRYLPAVPILIFMIFVFSNKNQQQNINETVLKANVPNNLLDTDTQKALFPGCKVEGKTLEELTSCSRKEMLRFVYKNIRYPAEARKDAVYGMVITRFNIEKDGSVTRPRIIKEVGAGLGEEVLRIVELMQNLPQKWIPAEKDGQKVRSVFDLPVKFQLEGTDDKGNNFSLRSKSSIKPLIVVTGLYDKNAIGKVEKEVDELPRFPGCEEAELTATERKKCANVKLFKFIHQNIQYPKAAKEANIQGTVVIKFVVQKDGQIAKARIIKNLGGGTGEEALKAVFKMNKMSERWIPGRKNGKVVNTEMVIPVKFSLNNNKGEVKSKIATKLSNARNSNQEVGQKPRFPGCEGTGQTTEEVEKCAQVKLLKYIYKNIKYPKAAKEANISGVAIIKFAVETDGRISNARIVKNLGGGAGEVALKAVLKMNEMSERWIPGMVDGKAVKTEMTIPVKFDLEGHKIAAKVKAQQQAKERLKPTANPSIFVSAYPNPAKEQLTIDIKGNSEPTELFVFDMAGKEVYKEKIAQFEGTYQKTINLEKVAKGTLIIKVAQGKNVEKKKVMIQ